MAWVRRVDPLAPKWCPSVWLTVYGELVGRAYRQTLRNRMLVIGHGTGGKLRRI